MGFSKNTAVTDTKGLKSKKLKTFLLKIFIFEASWRFELQI
jgi:hypothetical protein